MRIHPILNQELVQKHFDYHVDGFLIKKIKTARRSKVGSIVQTFSESTGYFVLNFNGKNHYVHKLIFLFHHGYIPENLIDHVDTVKTNNRISNLRESTYQCNIRNSGNRVDNKSGIKGVCWYKKYEKYQVRICVDGKTTNLGYTENLIDAAKIRL